jgi:serine/threonine-protein kinase
LLTGQFLYDFPAAMAKRVLMILQEDPVLLRKRRPDLPARLEPVLHKALARVPAQRYADVRQFAEALRPFAV